MNEKLGNLKDKLANGMNSVMELAEYTLNTMPNTTINDCFPAYVYEAVTIGKEIYQLRIECTLTKKNP